MMAATRQDAWSEDEDLLLAEIVLRHIREGSTQLAAFEEVGKKLSRTGAACGFRWNSAIRKKYQQAIELAKKQRKGHGADTGSQQGDRSQMDKPANGQDHEGQPWEKTIERIRQELDILAEELTARENGTPDQEIEDETKRLQKVNCELEGELKNLKADYSSMEGDYMALIKIMEMARKKVFLQNEDNTSFSMDVNGNLQRIKK